jgi:FkbM family methyltransferase
VRHLGLIAEIGIQAHYQRRLTRKLGWRYALRFRGAMLGARLGWYDGAPLRLHPPNLLHPIELRIGSTDADVYGQVLVDEQYAVVADGYAVEVIVDCGANVGYTSAYLLSRFPQARVVAIEPFPANALLCRRNLAPYGSRATVIEAAVWSHCTRLVLDHAGGKEWGVGVRAARQGEAGEIEAIDLPSLGLNRIDILKIDIEGSEAELFAKNTDRWLPSVSNIAIEFHGAECERQFRTAMADYRYVESRSGDLTICRGITSRTRADLP